MSALRQRAIRSRDGESDRREELPRFFKALRLHACAVHGQAAAFAASD
jgi:hypothetical protein